MRVFFNYIIIIKSIAFFWFSWHFYIYFLTFELNRETNVINKDHKNKNMTFS